MSSTGTPGAIDAILRRLYDELGERADVIATGGLAGLVVPYTEEIAEVDDLLTLTGLRCCTSATADTP